MKRRSFLSLVSTAALAALVPHRTYHFVNGLFQPDVSAELREIEEALTFLWTNYRIEPTYLWFPDEALHLLPRS